MNYLLFACLIALLMYLRPKSFSFYCAKHDGCYTLRHNAHPMHCPVCEPDSAESRQMVV